jgi:hypothetical protein
MSSLNQLQENVYCNSESYNAIYDKSVLDAHMVPLSRWITTTFIQPYLVFFSKLLQVSYARYNIPLQYQYHESGEQNRRGLELSVNLPSKTNLVIIEVIYRYIFDHHSPSKSYIIGDTETINSTRCNCIHAQQSNHVYTFRTKYKKAFHFTFHSPNPSLSSHQKTKGAFHLKIDSFITVPPHVVPYRPFLVYPGKPAIGSRTHFLPWNDFPSTDGYFTTTIVPGMLEISSFLRENPAIPVVYTVRGQSVHYLEDIVRPIYDKIVTDVLNPLVAVLPIHGVPAAVKYDPAHPTIPCHHKGTSLRTLKSRPKHQQTLRQRGRDLWLGGGRRRTTKRIDVRASDRRDGRICRGFVPHFTEAPTQLHATL